MKPYSFTLGKHYDLIPAEESSTYRFILLKPFTLRLPFRVPPASFCDYTGREWMYHELHHRTILPGYAWNGCSPKHRLPLLGWIGTPDPPATRLASLFHDAGYQFSSLRHIHHTRLQEDQLFLSNLQLYSFPLAKPYYRAVRLFGAPYWSSETQPPAQSYAF
jgi:hypothetical protein